MTTQYINSVIAVVPVSDFENSLVWYKKLLGREPDVVPMEGIAEWKIVEGAWIQVTLNPERAGSATVVLGVSNIETQHKICLDAGVSVGEIVEYPEVVKMVDAIDPEGNKIAFVQDISKRLDG
jgi:predicted enzyme related to lactoylglutathione lyase